MTKRIIFIASGVLLIADTVILTVNVAGFNTGIIIPAAAGLLLIAYSVFKIITNNAILIKNKKIKLTLTAMTTAAIISIITLELFISSATVRRKIPDDTKTMIILGAGLRKNRISPVLRRRLDTALPVMKAKPDMLVVVTGGKGATQEVTEAEEMKKYLAAAGVDPDRIVVENKSTSTKENLYFAMNILRENVSIKKNGIILVTNDFHMFRAKHLAVKAGFIPFGLPASTPLSIVINCHIREHLAIIKTFLLD